MGRLEVQEASSSLARQFNPASAKEIQTPPALLKHSALDVYRHIYLEKYIRGPPTLHVPDGWPAYQSPPCQTLNRSPFHATTLALRLWWMLPWTPRVPWLSNAALTSCGLLTIPLLSQDLQRLELADWIQSQVEMSPKQCPWRNTPTPSLIIFLGPPRAYNNFHSSLQRKPNNLSQD